MTRTIPKKKKCKKTKWLSEDALHIAEKRREVKGKGEKERYTHMNAEFQRIARRDKKTFLGDQCREISLGVSNFLEEISSLSHSIVFLHFFALITEEGFFISPCYFLEVY